MFALLALGGDIGCAAGPGLVGTISNAAGDSLKSGLLFAIIFPVLMLAVVMGLKRVRQSAPADGQTPVETCGSNT